MLHVQKVDRPDVVAFLLKVGGELFKQFALGVGNKNRFPALGATNQKRNDEAPRLSAAGRADAHQIVVVAGAHMVGHVNGVFVAVVGVPFEFAERHARHVLRGIQFQKLAHFALRQKARRAVRPLRENVKAPLVVDVFVS